MKYLFMLGAIAVIYYVFIREIPVAPVKEALTQAEAKPLLGGSPAPAAPAATSGLKRPIDRTRQVLGEVQQRNGKGEF